LALDTDERPDAGLHALEVQHRQVIRRLDRLAVSIADGRADEVASALRFLERYLADHFEAQERWMVERGYPGSIEHARLHAAVLAGIADARRAVEFVGIAAHALEKVRHAIDEHLRVDDLRLSQFLVARENLRRLAERGPGVGMSLTPIPGAVGGATPGGDATPPPASRSGVFATPPPVALPAKAASPDAPCAPDAPPRPGRRLTVVRGGKGG
jgi:hemerythrin